MSVEWLVASVLVAIAALTFLSLMSRRSTAIDKTEYRANWEKLQKYLLEEDTYGMAVLEADKLLDKAMKELKFSGSTTGERLVSAKKSFAKRDHIWMAHKLRNKVAHEEVKLTRKQAAASLSAFHRGLKDLDVL